MRTYVLIWSNTSPSDLQEIAWFVPDKPCLDARVESRYSSRGPPSPSSESGYAECRRAKSHSCPYVAAQPRNGRSREHRARSTPRSPPTVSTYHMDSTSRRNLASGSYVRFVVVRSPCSPSNLSWAHDRTTCLHKSSWMDMCSTGW